MNDCESINSDENISQVVSSEYTSQEVAEEKVSLQIIDDLYRSGRISLNQKLRLCLAFQEALLNALEHGNLELESSLKDEVDKEGVDAFFKLKKERLLDPKYGLRKIYITTCYDNNKLVIKIRNDGKAFVTEDIISKTISELNTAPYGRGIILIRSVMDELSYQDEGREIVMVKRL